MVRILLFYEDVINRIDCETQKWTQQCFHMYPLSPLPPALVP